METNKVNLCESERELTKDQIAFSKATKQASLKYKKLNKSKNRVKRKAKESNETKTENQDKVLM